MKNVKPTKNNNAEDRNTTKKLFILFNVKMEVIEEKYYKKI